MKKGLILSSVAAGLLFFAGCSTGGSDENTTTSSSTTTQTTTINGVVADGYIENAKVCIDLNKNSICDNNEPYTFTGSNGEYTLKYEGNIDTTTALIAQGGEDILRNTPFAATLNAPLQENANITPITTVVYSYMKNANVSLNDAVLKVASFLGISSSDVLGDPTKSETLQTISLEIELSAELIADLQSISISNVYMNMGKALKNSSDINTLLSNLNLDANTVAAIQALMQEVPVYVKENKISQIDNIKSLIKQAVLNAKQEGKVLSADDIIAYVNLNLNSLAQNDFTSKIEDYYKALELNKAAATIDDAKDLFKVVRDTIYEGYDFNDENNTATIFGEFKDAYIKALEPAVNNLNDRIKFYTQDWLNRVIIEGFGDSFNNEYNTTLSQLNDRISSITDVISNYKNSDNYSFTTSYGDEVVHKYTENNGVAIEIYSINDQNITAIYDPLNIETTLQISGSINIKDQNYSLTLNKIFEGSNFVDIEGYNGWIKGKTSHQININTFKIAANIDKSKFTNDYDSYTSVSNPEIEIKGNFTIPNGSFEGSLVLNSAGGEFLGKATYLNASFDGNLILATNFDDILTVARDEEYRVSYDDVLNGKIYLINSQPVVAAGISNYQIIGGSNTKTVEEKYDTILITSNGDTARCSVDTFYNNTGEETDSGIKLSLVSTTMNCDNNVTSVDISGYKKVSVEINGTHYLSSLDHWNSYDSDNNRLIFVYDYHFKDGSRMFYDVDSNKTVFCGDYGCISNPNINSVNVENAKNVLDIPAKVIFTGNATLVDFNASLDIALESKGDGRSYAVYVNNLNVYDKNTSSTVSADYAEFNFESNNSAGYVLGYDGVIRFEDNEDSYISNSLIKNVNATVYDKNNNPITLQNLSIEFNTPAPIGEGPELQGTLTLDGNISYLDVTLSGYTSYDFDNDNLTAYLNVNKNNYPPFTFGAVVNNLTDLTQDGYFLISRDTDLLAGKFNVDNDTFNANIISNKGVIVDVNKSDKTVVTIKDGDGNVLATFDPNTNTITYSDGTSETLY